MTRETITATVMVWLIGALVGWFTGWTARGEQNRLWHRGLAQQLAETRAQLDDAFAELDTYTEAHQVPLAPVSAVVHVHVSPPLPWTPGQPLSSVPVRAITAPVLPTGGAES